MLYNIWSLLLSQLQTLQASWPLSSIHQSPCISKSKYILLHNHRSVIKFGKFRIDSYFLTDGPYLHVASAPRAVPSLHTTPIRGASQGLWVAWSCLVSSVSAIIFSRHWYFLKMVGCMEFCRFGYVWLFLNRLRSAFGRDVVGVMLRPRHIAPRCTWCQWVPLLTMVTPIPYPSARHPFALCNISNLWEIHLEIV